MSVIALVPAAGAGSRLGAARPKAFVELAGEALVAHAVRGLLHSGVVDGVVVAVPAAELAAGTELLDGMAAVVVGGADRSASVRSALAYTQRTHPDADVILVHDAARALTPAEVVRGVVAAVRSGRGAVVPVLPLADTVKELDVSGLVVATPARARLRSVQTPQGFAAELLARAYAAERSAPAVAVTDDAGLVEALGVAVHTVPGDPLSFKITTAWDLRLAELLLAEAADGAGP